MHTKVKGFSNYEIYTTGDVFNVKTKKWKEKRVVRGYYYVDLTENGYRKNLRLGRLVAQHFIPNTLNLPQVNHKDGDCFNDDMSNLEWVSVSRNQIHKIELQKKKGTYKSPVGNNKFSEKDIQKVHDLRKKGFLHKEIAKKMKMGVSIVTHILLGSRRPLHSAPYRLSKYLRRSE